MKHFGSTWPSDPGPILRADGMVNLERVCPIEGADLGRVRARIGAGDMRERWGSSGV